MTDSLVFLHTLLARALVAFAVVLGIWGTYGYFRHAQVSGGFRSSYLIMAGLTAVQGLAGLAVFALGHPPGGSKRREAVILAGAAWIVAIAYLRGISTG